VFNKIIKRDGRQEDFDPEKITNAIAKAGKASNQFDLITSKNLTLKVLAITESIFKDQVPNVEEIQDVVEEVLLDSSYRKTAKAYIIYRDQHERIRQLIAKSNVNLIDTYLQSLDWKVKENSNMSYSLQGLNNYIFSEISKTYWLNKIYPDTIRDAHLKGSIHMHDLNLLSVYCVGWDLRDLLNEGFKGAEGKTESGPPQHFRSALGQIVNFFYTLQGEAAGAQAFANFDTFLAPFIKEEDLSYKTVKQAVQEFVFNLNVPTRVGFQTPFTNITMDLKVPSIYQNEPAMIGGKTCNYTYNDCQKEMIMINQAFLEVMAEGDVKGRVFTFPIPTYNIGSDFDWDNPELDDLWKVTARYGIPYFANFINSELSPDDARSMCCRLRLDTRKLNSKGGGLFGANPLTGSIGVVTINLPRIGLEAQNEDEFISILNDRMDIAKESLEIKRKILEKMTDQNLYPYTSFYLRNIKKRFNQYWSNHFSTIGIIGMHEACLRLFNQGIDTKQGKDFAIKVLNHMRDVMQTYQDETGNHYNLEATPAEGTAYRLAQLDRDQFFQEFATHNNDNQDENIPYYTNSSQLPVDSTNDIYALLDHQEDLQVLYTGGTVVHIFVGEEIKDFRALKNFIRKTCQNYRTPYITISPTYSICRSHGYLSGRHDTCPQCDQNTEVYSRIVGYLRPVNQWNKGKAAEFDKRKLFSVTDSREHVHPSANLYHAAAAIAADR